MSRRLSQLRLEIQEIKESKRDDSSTNCKIVADSFNDCKEEEDFEDLGEVCDEDS